MELTDFDKRVDSDDYETLKKLFESGVPYTRHALDFAVVANRLDVVKLLVESGRPIKYYYAHAWAIEHGYVEMLKYLLNVLKIKYLKEFSINFATHYNHTGVIKTLIDYGISLNPKIEEKPIEEKPIEEKPIEEKPIEEKPIEKEPIEKEPIEKEPIEKEQIV